MHVLIFWIHHAKSNMFELCWHKVEFYYHPSTLWNLNKNLLVRLSCNLIWFSVGNLYDSPHWHIHTSGCNSLKSVVPPFAHKTGNCIADPAYATACADCPFPITTTPANGRFSLCWHNESNTFTENLSKNVRTREKTRKKKWIKKSIQVCCLNNILEMILSTHEK